MKWQYIDKTIGLTRNGTIFLKNFPKHMKIIEKHINTLLPVIHILRQTGKPNYFLQTGSFGQFYELVKFTSLFT